MEQFSKSRALGLKKADAAADIALINQYGKKELKPEDVYSFSVRICDNDVDRDERFTNATMEVAGQKNSLGEALVILRGSAYMLRNETNQPLTGALENGAHPAARWGGQVQADLTGKGGRCPGQIYVPECPGSRGGTDERNGSKAH